MLCVGLVCPFFESIHVILKPRYLGGQQYSYYVLPEKFQKDKYSFNKRIVSSWSEPRNRVKRKPIKESLQAFQCQIVEPLKFYEHT